MAGREFHKAVKAEPQGLVHHFWSGKLLRQIGYVENSDECFSRIPSEHRLYSDAQNALKLTARLQTIDREDDHAMDRLLYDISKEHSRLMDITIDMATGRLQ